MINPPINDDAYCERQLIDVTCMGDTKRQYISAPIEPDDVELNRILHGRGFAPPPPAIPFPDNDHYYFGRSMTMNEIRALERRRARRWARVATRFRVMKRAYLQGVARANRYWDRYEERGAAA